MFKLAESHFQQWAGVPDRTPDAYAAAMGLFVDPLTPGWTDHPDHVLWELAVKEGYGLTATVTPVDGTTNAVWRVADPDKGQAFHACLDATLSPDLTKQLALGPTDLFVCRDSALDDTLAANLALQCRLKTI